MICLQFFQSGVSVSFHPCLFPIRISWRSTSWSVEISSTGNLATIRARQNPKNSHPSCSGLDKIRYNIFATNQKQSFSLKFSFLSEQNDAPIFCKPIELKRKFFLPLVITQNCPFQIDAKVSAIAVDDGGRKRPYQFRRIQIDRLWRDVVFRGDVNRFRWFWSTLYISSANLGCTRLKEGNRVVHLQLLQRVCGPTCQTAGDS